MNIWMITTGSSDVQLKNKANWNTLSSKARSELGTNKQFSLSESEKSGQKRWLVPSRAMGIVYGQALAEHYNDLDFPLLNSFSGYLKKEQIELNRIIVLLTDQSDVVSATNKDKPSHPYWQDTCTLTPILQQYLKNQFPDVVMDSDRDFLVLKPKSGLAGLDDWNEVLNLVQQEFIKLDIPEDATVYVSHQAGTPAISSAVQFESLAQFGQQVKFLVSNEQDSKLTKLIDSSSYLKRIRVQEALALLNNFDYSGVYQLLKDDLERSNLPGTQEILENLDIAMLWNYAKFEEFLHRQLNLSQEAAEEWWHNNWWKPCYEAAYLARIRFKQGNIVEAFFHSFRAVEGAFLEWGKQEFKSHIKINNDRAYLQPSILYDSKDYFKAAKINPDDPKKNNSLGDLKLKFEKAANKLENLQKNQQQPKGELLYGTTLYRLFETQKPASKSMAEYNRFLAEDGIGDKRNKNFHQLQGLRDKDFYQDWEVENLDEWETRILNYLNFISDKSFHSLAEASLMSQIHQELVNAIASQSL